MATTFDFKFGLISLLFLLSISKALAATIHLAGDSTMATWASTSANQGWGVFLPNYTTLDVSNRAVSGRSARSYTREGRFDTLAAEVKEGDFVVVEFGHNDGGSLTGASGDNGRSACGEDDGRCETVYDGVPETVYTFTGYLVNATTLLRSRGAIVVISSQTPNNVWETGSYVYSPSRFVGLAENAAKEAGVEFVDHGSFVAENYKEAGGEVVGGWFPVDHTHTSSEGAEVVAKSFAEAIVRGKESVLGDFIQGV